MNLRRTLAAVVLGLGTALLAAQLPSGAEEPTKADKRKALKQKFAAKKAAEAAKDDPRLANAKPAPADIKVPAAPAHRQPARRPAHRGPPPSPRRTPQWLRATAPPPSDLLRARSLLAVTTATRRHRSVQLCGGIIPTDSSGRWALGAGRWAVGGQA